MAVADPTLPAWFSSNGLDEYADILTQELGVEEFDDFRLLRDEKDANELISDICNLKPMTESLQQSLKTELLKIMNTERPKPRRQNPAQISTEMESIPETHESEATIHIQISKTPQPSSTKSTKSLKTKPALHKKSHSVMTLQPKKLSKSKSSPKQQKAKPRKKSLSKSISSTSLDEDVYDMESVALNKMSKSTSAPSKPKKKKLKHSQSMGLLEAKKSMSKKQNLSRRQLKEKNNESRGGFTVHTNRRVRLDDGRIGIVKFKGRTAFGKSGEDWIGIVIEYGKGQHNGSVNGRSYFRCRDGKGVMVRPDRLIEDLGNPNTKVLDDAMKKGSEEIQQMLKDIARQRKIERIKKKKAAMEAAAAKEQSNYGGDVGWTPAKFDNYKQDDGDMFGSKLMHSKTLLDKNKDKKATKKKKVNEI